MNALPKQLAITHFPLTNGHRKMAGGKWPILHGYTEALDASAFVDYAASRTEGVSTDLAAT
jgi:hypothetical protein